MDVDDMRVDLEVDYECAGIDNAYENILSEMSDEEIFKEYQEREIEFEKIKKEYLNSMNNSEGNMNE